MVRTGLARTGFKENLSEVTYGFAYCLLKAELKEYTQKLCKKAEVTRSVSVTKSRHFKKPTYAMHAKIGLASQNMESTSQKMAAFQSRLSDINELYTMV